jgi:hypothetical protein
MLAGGLEAIEAGQKAMAIVAIAGAVANGGLLRPEAKYRGSGKHGIEWKEGQAHAINSKISQGRWGSEADLSYAAQKASGLAPRQADYFDLPQGHSSIVYRPDGTIVTANRFWVRNNGTGTFHGYPTE